jgi:hypothetical protein
MKSKKKSHKLLKRAKAVARQVSDDLRRKLDLRKTRWRKVMSRFRPGTGAYGRYSVAALDEDQKVTFDVWVDRKNPNGPKRSAPMLAASFCEEDDLWNSNRSQFPSCPSRQYGSTTTGRGSGFGGKEVAETEVEPHHRRYLTVYRPPAGATSGRNDHPGDPLDPGEAFRCFLAFFKKWRTRVESRAPTVPNEQLRSAGDTRDQLLIGLLGELAVMERLGKKREGKAKWMVGRRGSHDIEVGKRWIEVKTVDPVKMTCIMTHAEIQAGTNPRQEFAIVTVPEQARQLVRGGRPSLVMRKPSLTRYEEDISRYLKTWRVRCAKSTRARLASALPLVKKIRFYRFAIPRGWQAAFTTLDNLAMVINFSQEFKVSQFFREKAARRRV